MRKYLLITLAIIALLYSSLIGWLYINQRSLQYFPDCNIKSIEEYHLENTQDLIIESEDGSKVQIWYHEPSSKDKPMILYLHGNSYSLGYRVPKFQEFINNGYGFIAPSYPGFGKSEGKPSEKTIMADVVATINFMKSKGYDTKNSIIIGESLGTGIAVMLAAEYQFGGVFLITPYTSIANRAQEIYWYLPIKYLVKDNFISEDRIDRINAPLLIVHGSQDKVIPHSHAEHLIELAHEPKKLIIYEGKGHTNLDDKEIINEMTKYFIDEERIEIIE